MPTAQDESLAPYFAQVTRVPLLTSAEERMLFQRLHRGDPRARERIASANQRLVVKVAMQYFGNGMSLGDLVGEGNLGLMRAIDKFDLNRRCRFSTYGVYWIRQAVSRAIEQKSHLIRPPVDLAGKAGKYQRAVEHLRQHLGREPFRREVAQALRMDESEAERLSLAARAVRGATSLSVHGASDAASWRDSSARSSESDWLRRIERRDLLSVLAGAVSAREQEVLRLRYGLDGKRPMTLREIAQREHVSRARIGQIEQQALKKMAAAARRTTSSEGRL